MNAHSEAKRLFQRRIKSLRRELAKEKQLIRLRQRAEDLQKQVDNLRVGRRLDLDVLAKAGYVTLGPNHLKDSSAIDYSLDPETFQTLYPGERQDQELARKKGEWPMPVSLVR